MVKGFQSIANPIMFIKSASILKFGTIITSFIHSARISDVFPFFSNCGNSLLKSSDPAYTSTTRYFHLVLQIGTRFTGDECRAVHNFKCHSVMYQVFFRYEKCLSDCCNSDSSSFSSPGSLTLHESNQGQLWREQGMMLVLVHERFPVNRTKNAQIVLKRIKNPNKWFLLITCCICTKNIILKVREPTINGRHKKLSSMSLK